MYYYKVRAAMLGSKTTAPRGVGPVPKQTRMRHDPVQTVALGAREDGMLCGRMFDAREAEGALSNPTPVKKFAK